MTNLDDLKSLAVVALNGAVDGAPLDALSAAFIQLGCCVSVCSLDRAAIDQSIEKAFAAGAGIEQVQEVIALVSGLGVHSLMVSSVPVLAAARRHGRVDRTMDEKRRALWDHYVGDDPFWKGFEAEVPGFLQSMLILSPDIFEGFFTYCAIPWKSGTVPAVTKELIAMASDATPSHRFAPGFRIHLRNAVALGASKAMILETLRIAARTPEHKGTA